MLILLVCFVVVMLVWLLLMLGTIGPAGQPAASPGPQAWLAWFASLILGLTLFLYGYGVVEVVQRSGTVR